MQFGAGAQLSAQCTQAPTPDGWRPWVVDADGPVPPDLSARAGAVNSDQSVPLGATESYPLPGVVTLLRVEPRVWGRDASGNLVQGCWRAVGIYLPAAAAPAAAVTPPATADAVAKTVGVLTAVSLAVGTVATVASMRSKK
jgi:hypothetical protein